MKNDASTERLATARLRGFCIVAHPAMSETLLHRSLAKPKEK
jgi:hypothetical protein